MSQLSNRVELQHFLDCHKRIYAAIRAHHAEAMRRLMRELILDARSLLPQNELRVRRLSSSLFLPAYSPPGRRALACSLVEPTREVKLIEKARLIGDLGNRKPCVQQKVGYRVQSPPV
jgi:hypothetical protein